MKHRPVTVLFCLAIFTAGMTGCYTQMAQKSEEVREKDEETHPLRLRRGCCVPVYERVRRERKHRADREPDVGDRGHNGADHTGDCGANRNNANGKHNHDHNGTFDNRRYDNEKALRTGFHHKKSGYDNEANDDHNKTAGHHNPARLGQNTA